MVAILKQLLLYLASWSAGSWEPEPCSDLLSSGAMEVGRLADQVQPGNFTHVALKDYAGVSLQIFLFPLSEADDPDLYVLSGHASADLVTVDRYSFRSATFGVEIVLVPHDAPRPLSIGVFGGRLFVPSQFILKVCSLPDLGDNYSQLRQSLSRFDATPPDEEEEGSASYDAVASRSSSATSRDTIRADDLRRARHSRKASAGGGAAANTGGGAASVMTNWVSVMETVISFVFELLVEIVF